MTVQDALNTLPDSTSEEFKACECSAHYTGNPHTPGCPADMGDGAPFGQAGIRCRPRRNLW